MEISTLKNTEIPFFKLEKKKPKKIESNKLEKSLVENNSKSELKELLLREVGENATGFIENYSRIESSNTLVTATTTRFNIDKLPSNYYSQIVNISRVNDIRWINKFFESVNSKLSYDGVFIGCVETKKERKTRILKKIPFPFNWFLYTFDFLHKRVAPKIWLTKKLYFHLTKGKNRIITKAETLGRLVSCGFQIVEDREIVNKTWFIVKKVSKPLYDNNPSYGPLYKMPRVGKDGKIIHVYKMRTMHPFSEYLQDYMVERYGYDNEGKGKIKSDFRRTSYGIFFRKFWLDELPQLINVFKGEMSLVGVRPLSKTRFNEFPEDMKKRRTKYKPGCFPPYVALLMPNEEDNIKAEKIYLDQKEKHPIWTDIKFFWLSVYNILTNKIRSA